MKPKFAAEGDSFIIENYNHASPFASFFPALAGETGKPLWVFFTNRGQAISSFGVNNKDGSMLEFLPANKAYQATPLLGFRTFIRDAKKKNAWYEPFIVTNEGVQQTLIVRPYEIELREVNRSLGLEVTVRYFGVPNETYPVLARSLSIKNTPASSRSFDVLDGLPRVVPWGMGDFLVKNMSRTIEAFAEVTNHKNAVPFFKLKVEPDDRPNVRRLTDGFFSFTTDDKQLLPIIVDPHIVFGHDSSFFRPASHFGQNGSSLDKQLLSNIMPSSFSHGKMTLKPKQEKTWQSFYGYSNTHESANAFAQKVIEDSNYFDSRRNEMKGLYENLVKQFGLRTSNSILNSYGNNTFMDNVLRGGFPLSLSQNGPIVHVYSRKHGDMERDYNAFQISAAYYSQGNGNFRDVNQNRRHDLFLNPMTGTTNVDFFFNLLQLDGYNPLVINPTRFILPRDIGHHADFKMNDNFKLELQFLRRDPVLPGQVYEFILRHAKDKLNVPQLFKDIIQKATPQRKVKHGEGFWIDHWTYNLDHLDHYLSIFPDKKKWLFFEKKDFTFHDSDHFVVPRKEKYVVTKQGKFRQLNSVARSKDKGALIDSRRIDPHRVRTKHGEGEVFQTTLFVKLMSLAVVKVSSLDPFGAGIEMEADKPGWCDALNGAPGLFGSSTHEMFELHRLVKFLLSDVIPLASTKNIEIPQEIAAFIKEVSTALSHASQKDFRPTWDKMSTAREHFREKTFPGVSGKSRTVRVEDLKQFLERASKVLTQAESKVIDPKTKLPTSYFTHTFDGGSIPSDWKTKGYKIPWQQHRVAPFLEGAVHAMKMWPLSKAKKLYKNIKTSQLSDKKLGMYRLNVSLKDESSELGRIRVFSQGWLENESIFLHMHYKYLLEILRSGMTEDFFKEIKSGMIPFRDMKTYGRPIFENSSFLASSLFPKKEVHGKGYVARLSGATSEFLSMIYFLFFGANPFQFNDDQVFFQPKPQLPAEWFSKKAFEFTPKNSLSLSLFGVPITLINDSRKNTYGASGVLPISYEWILDGRFYTQEGDILPSDASIALREGRLESLTIFLGRSSKKSKN